MKTVKLTENVFTTAIENVLDGRMPAAEYEPILTKMDEAGYYAVSCIGENTFASAFKTLDDPWPRLQSIKKYLIKTKLMMTMDASRIFSDHVYPERVITSFVEVCAENGIDVFRFYDGENRIAALETAVRAAADAGAEVQIAFLYDGRPEPSIWKQYAEEAASLHADAVVIRDTMGIMRPFDAAAIYKALSETIDTPLGIEMQQRSGFAEMCYLKAAENGCSLFDVTISPMSTAATTPGTEVICEILGKDTSAEEAEALQEVSEFFIKKSEEYISTGIFSLKSRELDLTQDRQVDLTASSELYYDDLTEDDVRRIRAEIALVEKDPLDAVTYAMYPEEALTYFHNRNNSKQS